MDKTVVRECLPALHSATRACWTESCSPSSRCRSVFSLISCQMQQSAGVSDLMSMQMSS